MPTMAPAAARRTRGGAAESEAQARVGAPVVTSTTAITGSIMDMPPRDMFSSRQRVLQRQRSIVMKTRKPIPAASQPQATTELRRKIAVERRREPMMKASRNGVRRVHLALL